MNKEQCLQLIDKLSDKTLSFGCAIVVNADPAYGPVEEKDIVLWASSEKIWAVNGAQYKRSDLIKIIGHPPKIGDVLCIFSESCAKAKLPTLAYLNRAKDLLRLWTPLCPRKSMLEIMEESGFEELCVGCGGLHPECKITAHRLKEHLKDPKARALFEFINNTLK